MQKFVALNTLYRKIHEKTSYIQNPERCRQAVESHLGKQEKHLKCSRDAEANDMINLGSDHRSVVTQLVIPEPTKERHPKRKHLMWRRKSATDDNNDQVSESAKSEKNIKFEKRYSELERRSMQKTQMLRKVKENRHARKMNQQVRKNSAGKSLRKKTEKKQQLKMNQQTQETKATQRKENLPQQEGSIALVTLQQPQERQKKRSNYCSNTDDEG